jgi:hypothetical protein
MTVSLCNTYRVSEDVVAREIEGDIIIVPLVAGIGDLEDELFSLNEEGRAIWDKLDGSRTLEQVANELALEYDADDDVLARDVLGFVTELANRGIVVVEST